MTYNITDEQLNEIVKRAVQKALDELQVAPVLCEPVPEYGKKSTEVTISQADDDLAERAMETMAQNLETQNNPKVGIFLVFASQQKSVRSYRNRQGFIFKT